MAFTHQMTSNGDLLRTDSGDIQGECCCESQQDCPSDCSDCCSTDSLYITFSGFSSSETCNNCSDDCADLNGTWEFTRDWGGNGSCYWGRLAWLSCPAPSIYLQCSDSTWTLLMEGYDVGGGDFYECIKFEAPNVDGCPPETGWTLVSGDCTGGSMTVSCSS